MVQIKQIRVLTGGTNDQFQMITLWTYYAKTWLSGKDTGKGERKKKNMIISRMALLKIAMGALLEDLKHPVRLS